MPKKVLTLDAPNDLVLEWRGLFKTMTVTLGGRELGVFGDKRSLEAGQSFPLPSGSRLHVQLEKKFAGPELVVKRDGVPVAGSATDPEVQIAAAYGVLFFIAALNIGLGLVAELAHVGFLQRFGLGWPSVGFGAVFVVLGVLVWKARSRVALILGIVIFAVDGVLGMYLVMKQLGPNHTPPLGGIIMRVFLLLPMINGVKALGAKRATS